MLSALLVTAGCHAEDAAGDAVTEPTTMVPHDPVRGRKHGGVCQRLSGVGID